MRNRVPFEGSLAEEGLQVEDKSGAEGALLLHPHFPIL